MPSVSESWTKGWLVNAMNTLFLLAGVLTMCHVVCDAQARTMVASQITDDDSTKTQRFGTEHDLKSLILNASMPITFLNSVSSLQDQVAIEKRQIGQFQSQDVDHHWHCNTTVTWKDLGWLHYPRFVREVACATESCMHGFYVCRSQVYQVRVLTVRDENEDEEVTVPATLRHRWKFTEVAVSVACLCAT